MSGPTGPRSPGGSRPGTRVTAAVWLLVLATVVLVTCLVVREPVLIGAAAIFCLVAGWVALRLSWNALVLVRYAHAIDRTELAHTYRGLFAERAVEHAEFARAMRERLVQRDQEVLLLRAATGRLEIRAVEAEASASYALGELREIGEQVLVLEQMAARGEQERRARERARAAKPPLGGRPLATTRPAPTPAQEPEWVALEPDLVSSLMAWERHAAEMAEHRRAARHARRPAG